MDETFLALYQNNNKLSWTFLYHRKISWKTKNTATFLFLPKVAGPAVICKPNIVHCSSSFNNRPADCHADCHSLGKGSGW